MFIGQERLLNTLFSYSLQTFPKAVLLIGELGSGKHLIAEMIAKNLDLELIEITDNITEEDLISFQQNVLHNIYLINLMNFSERQQNKFLKFVEEPSKNVNIILISESETNVIETIKSRCEKFYLEQYSEEQLKNINFTYNSEIIYKICRTPGQILNQNEAQLNSLIELCKTIVAKFDKANFSNIVSISTKINYSDTFDKYDLTLFLNTLEYIAAFEYVSSSNELAYKIYTFINKFRQKLVSSYNLNKENFIINFLISLYNKIYLEKI